MNCVLRVREGRERRRVGEGGREKEMERKGGREGTFNS